MAEMGQDTGQNRPNGFQYWIPKPTLSGWRVRGLWFVNIMTAFGFCGLAVLGYLFNQLDQAYMGEWFVNFRLALLLGGSICLAIGSELGTFVTTIEIFRKQRMTSRRPRLARLLISVLAIVRVAQVMREALSKIAESASDTTFSKAIKMIDRTLEREERGAIAWDWIGLVVSAITSLSAVVLAYFSGVDVSDTIYAWLPVVQQWAPLGLFVCGVLDGYINHGEFGLFLASFDERVRQWYADREVARKEVERHNKKTK